MTRQEFYQKLHDSMSSKFDSLNENWQAIAGSLVEIQQGGTVSNELAVTYLAHSVQMLGLRLQYLQSTMKALAGGQIVNDHDFFEIPAGNQPEKSDRGLKN